MQDIITMESKKILLLSLIFWTHISCAQKITTSELNHPSEENFQTGLRNMADDIDAINEETYYFDRKIALRNKIMDSLQILKKNNRIILIDAEYDFNGTRRDISYFFYDNKLLVGYFTTTLNKKNSDNESLEISHVVESSIASIKEGNPEDILTVYNYFNKDNFKKIKGTINFGHFVFFNVTVVLNKEIKFYTIRSNKNGYKVTSE